MPPGYNYEADLGRDLMRMWEIIQGDFTLLGPQLNFAGLRLAPFHFYLFAPALAIFQGKVLGVLVANSLLFIVGLLVFYKLLEKHTGKLYAFCASVYLITSAYFLLAARTPGNAFSYLPALLILIGIVFWTRGLSYPKTLLIGVILSYSFHSHPVSFLVSMPLVLTMIYFEKSESVKKLLLLAIIFGVSFLPLVVFEISHEWLILKGLWGSELNTTPLGNFNFPNFSEMLALSLWGEIFLVSLLWILGKLRGKEIFYAVVGGLNLLLYYLLRQSVIHYYFPVFLLTQLILIDLFRNERWRFIFIGLLVIFNLFSFPKRLYQNTANLTAKEKNFQEFLHKILLPKNSLNVVLLNETHLSRVAYEYRFLLKKAGYLPLDEYSYKQSNYLLVVDETGSSKPAEFVSWEFAEFGKRKLEKQRKIGKTVYYLYSKQSSTKPIAK